MANEQNYYKELSLFNNIKSPGHRAWNRLMTVNNLKEQGRDRDATGYLEKLGEEQIVVAMLVQAIKKKGLETVRAELNRGIETNEAINHS